MIYRRRFFGNFPMQKSGKVSENPRNMKSEGNRPKKAVWKVASTAVMHHKNEVLCFWPRYLSGENSPETPILFLEKSVKNQSESLEKIFSKGRKYAWLQNCWKNAFYGCRLMGCKPVVFVDYLQILLLQAIKSHKEKLNKLYW